MLTILPEYRPLSVIASVTGLLAAAAKVTLIVSGFIEKGKDAPHSMRSVVLELSDLTLSLCQLRPFIQGASTASQDRREAISVEQIVAISTSLVLNMSELEKLVDSCGIDKPMSLSSILRWVRSEDELVKVLTRVQASKNSLNLILTIFTWWVIPQ